MASIGILKFANHRRVSLAAFLFLSVWLGPASSIRAEAPNERIVVRLHQPSPIVTSMGEPAGSLRSQLGVITLKGPTDMSTAVYLELLRNNPTVLWAEPEGTMLLTRTPNDSRFGEQTAASRLQLPAAWNETVGTSTTTVAVIDSGIDGQHEDLAGRVGPGFNFLTNAAVAGGSNSDDNGHGTAVAGVIGAATDNGKGIAGVDWQAQLMPLKVTNAAGEATSTRVANAIIYAVDQGAKVLNLSLGTATDFQVIRDAIAYAASKQVTMVAAAGNENGGPVLFPAAYQEVIAVGAVDNNDLVSSFSNVGPELDLVAPGETILSTALSADHTAYAPETGTSFAAPLVTGVASLILTRFPSLPPTLIQNLLTSQADKVSGMGGASFHPSYGSGRLNAARVLSFHAAWVSQTPYPQLLAGQSGRFEVRLQNTGQAVWTPSTIRLATDRSQDRISIFLREDRVDSNPSGWLSPNRISLVEAQVGPGAVGTFRFYYTIPTGTSPGVYREYFRPVAEELSWLENIGIFWDITVQTLADTYHAQWASQNTYPTLHAGESYQFEVRLMNTGTSVWQPSTVRLGTDRAQDRIPLFLREDRVDSNPSGWLSPNRISLVEAQVGPGAVGTFRFYYTIPTGTSPGVYREYFRPVAEHITFMEDIGIFWEVKVE